MILLGYRTAKTSRRPHLFDIVRFHPGEANSAVAGKVNSMVIQQAIDLVLT